MTHLGLGNESGRRDWVADQLSRLPPGARLLDAGAGEQQYRSLCDHLEYMSQDFAAYDGTGDGSALQTGSWEVSGLDFVCDIADIPAPDSSFDAILCTEVLEHLPWPDAALREFARLLRPGGQLLLTAPFAAMTHFAPYFYATGFSRHWYAEHLPAAGFAEISIEHHGSWFDSVAQELRRTPRMADHYSGAPMSRPRRLLWKLSEAVVLRQLSSLRQSDRGSDELMCYGLHVTAVRG